MSTSRAQVALLIMAVYAMIWRYDSVLLAHERLTTRRVSPVLIERLPRLDRLEVQYIDLLAQDNVLCAANARLRNRLRRQRGQRAVDAVLRRVKDDIRLGRDAVPPRS